MRHSEPLPGVALLTLTRPERLNAMDFQLVSELHGHLDDLATDLATRVVVLTGAGRAFCAGLDLIGGAGVPGTEHLGRPQQGLAVQKHIAGLVPKLRDLPQPVVPHPAPPHRRGADDVLRFGTETLDPAEQNVGKRGRQRPRVVARGHRDEFLGEEGVALGPFRDLPDDVNGMVGDVERREDATNGEPGEHVGGVDAFQHTGGCYLWTPHARLPDRRGPVSAGEGSEGGRACKGEAGRGESRNGTPCRAGGGARAQGGRLGGTV